MTILPSLVLSPAALPATVVIIILSASAAPDEIMEMPRTTEPFVVLVGVVVPNAVKMPLSVVVAPAATLTTICVGLATCVMVAVRFVGLPPDGVPAL